MSLSFCILLLAASVNAIDIGLANIASCSSFSIVKAVATFRSLDNNHDGLLTENDMHLGANDFANAVHLNEDEKKILQESTISTIWKSLRIDEGREAQPVTEPQYIELFCRRQQTRSNESQDRIAFARIFETADRDHDGSLDVNEYTGLMVVFKVEAVAATAAFQALDKNADGKISQDEYIDHGMGFLYDSDAASTSQLLAGLYMSKVTGL